MIILKKNELDTISQNVHQTATEGVYSGLDGVRMETANSTNAKHKTSKRSLCDVRITVDGKAVYAESKTNGGDIESLLTANDKKLVVYNLNWCKLSPSKDEYGYTEPIILPAWAFVRVATAIAYKNNKGRQHIQSLKKPWQSFADSYPLKFVVGTDYSREDIELTARIVLEQMGL